MLELYLARHGQNEDNANKILNGHRDLPLTEKGIEQAKEVAGKIKDAGLTFDLAYTSPLIRAKKTAEIICETIGIKAPIVLPELIERDFGVMTGKKIADIEKLCSPDILKVERVTYFLSPEGAETFDMLYARAEKIIKIIQEKHKDGKILLVGHGDIGKMIYAAYYKLTWKEVLLNFHFGNAELLHLSPDSPADKTHIFEIEQHNG